MRPTKLAYLLAPAFGAAILTVACSDQSPVAPQAVIERQDIDLSAGGSLSGRVVTTFRVFDGQNIIGKTLSADTSAFEAAIVPGGRSAARVTFAGKVIELPIAVGDNGKARRSGTQKFESSRIKGPNRSISLTSSNGAPTSEITLRIGGEVVSRAFTEWARVRGGWVATAHTRSIYVNGQLARSITTTFEDPGVARIAYSSTPIARSPVAPVNGLALPGARFDYSTEDGDQPCEDEVDAVEDAITAELAANALMAGACLFGGLGPCAAATVYAAEQNANFNMADDRLDECIAGI